MTQIKGSIGGYKEGLGALLLPDERCAFLVWAPQCEKVEVRLLDAGGERLVPLARDERGYHAGVIANVAADALYYYRLDGKTDRPDPASRAQPQGVHGPSQVIASGYHFSNSEQDWQGLPLDKLIIYELHVGTFSEAGTFAGVIEKLDALVALGVNAIELMPLAEFPGERNWGYDGVYLFAIKGSYGGPQGLLHLVEACHARGIAVIIDVVYNHLGPEGNYLSEFGPYFTDRYRTGWGGAVNLDGPHSDEVRRFLCENARAFVRDFHVDGLRLDAVHALFDCSARPFLRELCAAVKEEADKLGRPVHVIAESDSNDARLIMAPERGGYGLSAQWSDDVHHALHALLTGERGGYYKDFGGFCQLVKALREGFVYTGEYSPARKRSHGSPAEKIAPSALIVCAQNHDQIGNRMLGERLSALVSESGLRLAVAAVLLGPFVPMLFMGEEYGESAPFLYFVSHGDSALIDAVRRGRRAEFSAFAWQGEPPDPQAETTFLRSRLHHELHKSEVHARLFAYYKKLIALRRAFPAFGCVAKQDTTVAGLYDEVLLILRRVKESQSLLLLHFGQKARAVVHPLPQGRWRRMLDTTETLPPVFDSTGELGLSLLPGAVVAYIQDMPAGGTA